MPLAITKQVSQVLQTLLANKDHEKTYKNEKERLQAQLSNCPDDVDTEDKEIFEEMPVEDFGMAMLRGMGWNPKKKVKLVPASSVKIEGRPPPRRQGPTLMHEVAVLG